MEETLQLIQSFGGLVVLSALFVWQWIEEKKTSKEEKSNNQKILKELANSNNNIAESLSLLKMSIDIQSNEFKKHDERAIREFAEIKQELMKMEGGIGTWKN